MNKQATAWLVWGIGFFLLPAFSQAAELQYDASDLLKIYALEIELYNARVKAEKKLQLKKLIAKEAAAAGISAEEWEKHFFENNEPSLSPEVAAKLERESEQTKKIFEAGYRAQLKDKLWNELSKKYGVRVNLPPPQPPAIRIADMNERSVGDKTKATIRIAEFFDIECPHCREASGVYARIREEFGSSITWSAYNFPAETAHPAALEAHLASECAGEQRRFFEFREILFAAPKLNRAVFSDAARRINLDEKLFAACITEQRAALVGKIRNQADYAKTLGIPGTPTLVINGRPYPGVRSYNELRRILVQLRAGKKS